MDWLGHEMLRDLEVQPGSKVDDIEPKIRLRGQKIACPRDGKLGAAYVDVAQDEHAGRATAMLSYAWGYEVHTISETLMTHCRRLRANRQQFRVWICAFCVNQWRVREAITKGSKVPFEVFQAEFGDKVKKIGKILALITPWDNPLYLTRVWTIYECYMGSTDKDVSFKFILPEADERSFSEVLRGDSAISMLSELFKTISELRVQKAQARYSDDRKNVMKVLTGSALDERQLDALVEDRLEAKDELAVEEACKEINLHVVRKLHECFITSGLGVLDLEVDRCLTGFSRIGWMCNQIGLYEEGLHSLNTGIDTARAFYGGSSGMSDSNALALSGLMRAKAKLLTYRGMSQRKSGEEQGFDADFAEAYELYRSSKELLEEHQLVNVLSYAEVLGDLSIWHGKKGDLRAAIEMGLLSKKAFEDSGRAQTIMYGNILKSLGISYHRRAQSKKTKLSCQRDTASAETAEEDHQLATEMFARSEALFISISQCMNPWYLDLLTQQGALLAEQGEREEALAKFLLAKSKFEALGLQKSPQYEQVQELLSQASSVTPSDVTPVHLRIVSHSL